MLFDFFHPCYLNNCHQTLHIHIVIFQLLDMEGESVLRLRRWAT